MPKTAISLARPAKKSLGSHIQTARADVYRAAKFNPTVVYDIFAGKSRPGRDNALMLAFGMRCDLKETQRLLRLAGVSELWPKVRRDHPAAKQPGRTSRGARHEHRRRVSR